MARVFYAALSALAVMLALGGVVSFIVGLRRLRIGAISRGWPRVIGVITSSHVASKTDQSGELFHAAITFRYTVGGREFTGTRVTAEQLETSSRAAAEAVVTRYREGVSVPVFYAREEPSLALLEPGLTLASLTVPLLGASC